MFSSVRHPQSNPTERVMREIGRMLRTFCHLRHTSWADHITRIEELLNITTHHSTQCTPRELHFGIPVRDEIERLIKFPGSREVDHEYMITLARQNMKRHFEARRKGQRVSSIELNVGDKVLLRVKRLSNALDKVTQKFFHLFEGPNVISQCLGPNAFVLVDSRRDDAIVGTYNRANLRKYRTE